LAEAEHVAKKNGYKKMAIISGVGVREYYRKLGYKLEKTYMVSTIDIR
jgi:elongator complex protein 3